MRRLLVLAPFVIAVSTAHAQPPDPLSSLRFLIGDWQAIDTAPGESGAFTFKLAVQDRIMVRTNEATYTATAEHEASRHDDLLTIYSENGSLKAIYFDSEGHVIRYAVQLRQQNVVVFESDVSQRDPTYRLTYSAGNDGILVGSFEIAPPGSSVVFKPYLSWKARRR